MGQLKAALGWPAHALGFLRSVLISRGGSKALNIRKQLRRYVEGLTHVTDSDVLTGTVRRLSLAACSQAPPLLPPAAAPAAAAAATTEEEALRREAVQEHYRLAMHADKHLHILASFSRVNVELRRWLAAILDVPAQRMFVAGDSEAAALFLPSGFQVSDVLASCKAVAARYVF
jgi:hypothetical protein